MDRGDGAEHVDVELTALQRYGQGDTHRGSKDGCR
jgi:hypothetical protein